MLWRDSGVVLFLLLSLVFSILTLTAGNKRGMLDDVAIATHQYEKNSTLFSPPRSSPHIDDNFTPLLKSDEQSIYAFFFKVHYLSLCAGWEGYAKAHYTYNHVECISKPLGWTFHPDDPFIAQYGIKAGNSSVIVDDVDLEILQTKGPAATLVLGLVFTILAVLAFTFESLEHGIWMDLNIAKVSTILMALAASSSMVSSALITHTILTRRKHASFYDGQFTSWTNKFFGLTWTTVVLMYIALIWKAWNDVWRKENRMRRLRSNPV